MLDLSPVAIGVLLFLLGLVFVILTLLFLRLIPRLPGAPGHKPATPVASTLLDTSEEAVLVVQTGGRILYINQPARDLFSYWEPAPNLENLARRSRPSEVFLALCAGQSHARFMLKGRFIEGSSFYLPPNLAGGSGQGAYLVSLRRPGLMLRDSDGARADLSAPQESLPPGPGSAGQTFNFFTELTRTMASSLDLENTLKAILESIERLFPSDLMEISIWDPEAQRLTPYRLVGLPGIDRRLEKVAERHQANAGYSGFVVANQEALLVLDAGAFRLAQPADDRQRYPYQSYLGAPMLIGGCLVGTLELASLAKESYSENDLEVVNLLSGQAAVAVNNALLYAQELQRSTELAGLANLAQSVSVVRDPQDLYARLIDSISGLLVVEILGFLIYDENRRILEGQEPFLGLQPNVLEWLRAPIDPGSPAEAIWQQCDPIVVSDAPEDPRIQAFGLHHLALAAGIRQTVWMPLSSSGRTLGYLLAANKRDGTPFDSNDLRILAIIAGQAAPIIDNAALVQQSRRRAQRAETLRRIASLTSSAATLEEIIKFSVLDLARLLQADAAVILLRDESRDELRLHRPSAFGVSLEAADRLGRLAVEDPRFSETATGSRQLLFQEDLSAGGATLSAFYQPLVDAIQIHSVISAPLAVRERTIGELFIASQKPGYYSHGDAQTVATAAWQLAAAIERSALYSQTDQNLRRRVDQLVALTRVSRELNTTLDLEGLLQRVYDEAIGATRSDCGSILLFDLSAAGSNGTAAPVRLHLGCPHPSDLDLFERRVVSQAETLIVPGYASDAAHEPGEAQTDAYVQADLEGLLPAHTGVQSAMGVPIAYQGRVAGILHLHSQTPGHFGEPEREIGEALAIQAAIAIGNAQRYEEQQRRSVELKQRVETLSRIFDVTQILQTEQPLEQSLEAIAAAIQSTTPFEIVLISVYEPEGDHFIRKVGAGIPQPEMDQLLAHPARRASLEGLLQPRYRQSNSYFIPSEQSELLPDELVSCASPTLGLLAPANENGANETSEPAWKPNDLLLMPLYTGSGEPLGLISVDWPRDHTRPNHATIETLEIFGSQAALVIETQLKVHGLRSQALQMADELEFARRMAEKAQAHLPVLLHKDLEQTLAAQALSQRARRIPRRAGNHRVDQSPDQDPRCPADSGSRNPDPHGFRDDADRRRQRRQSQPDPYAGLHSGGR